jgi:glucose-1-phosphate adenylyltransferase
MNTRSTPDLSRMQALILAGGEGKHLFPLTLSRPKPVMMFGGIFRIVDFTLSNCLRSKLTSVALLTQYQHEQLRSYIGYGWTEVWNNSRPQPQPLLCLPPSNDQCYRGTADAVFKNLSILESTRPEFVLIVSGDHVYDMDYRGILARHLEMQADVTIATVERPLKNAPRFGVVGVDQNYRVTGFEQKPRNPRLVASRRDRAFISMGVYLFKTDVLIQSLIENCDRRFGYDFGEHVIPSLIGSARVFTYEFRDELQNAPRYWRDIGTIDGYYDANMDLVRPSAGFNLYRHPTAGNNVGCSRSSSVHIYSNVSQSVLSPGVRVEERASVQDSVLMPGAWIGPGATVRHAIVEEGVHIPADFRIGWDANEDRKRYIVSPAGVVVVSQIPQLCNTVTDFEAFGHFNSLRATA